MIAIIDYGMGNLFSVEKAFKKLGADVLVTSDKNIIANAEKAVLPGVGAFGDCMKNLQEYQLIDAIKDYASSGKPLLGICLGLQLMFEQSAESHGIKGLGIFKGTVKKINAPALKIPHMGWNDLCLGTSTPLLNGLPLNPYVYFVHSYQAVPEDEKIITAYCMYGEKVTAAVGRENVQAVQFHPEKSSNVGMRILQNFVEL